MKNTGLRALFVCLLIAIAAGAFPAPVAATASAGAGAQAERQPAASQESHAAQAEHGEEAHGGGWLAVIAKAVNFAILVAVLAYFLKSPLMGYLDSRITQVREDIVTAAQTRETASRQLAEIEARLKALPAEIETLKARGAEEIAAERVRIEQAAAAERQRVLEHTRREIDMRLRVARRDLMEHAAELAVQVASTRIRGSITPEDQARLLDRYTSQVGARS